MNFRVRLWQCLLALFVSASVVANPSLRSSHDVHGMARVGERPAPDAVIWLTDAPNGPDRLLPGPVVLDQRNLTFIPHVLVVRTGTTVDFPNNDRVFHNVFSFRDGKRFDLGLYPVGARRRVRFDQPGLSRIFCNIHPNMAAYVMTVDSGYFARADENGAFTLTDVPEGTYKFRAWRPGVETELTGTWTPADRTITVAWP